MMQCKQTLAAGALALAGAAASLPCQIRVTRFPVDTPSSADRTADGEIRRVLGLSVSFSATARDTLGILVSSVVPGGPGELAGVNEGSRLGEVNGLSLRLAPEEVGQSGVDQIVMRGLIRQLRAVRPGDSVLVRVFTAGRYRTVRVPTAAPVSATSNDNLERLARNERDARVAPTPTLSTIIEALGRIQTQLRQLPLTERAESPDAGGGDASGGSGGSGLPGLRVSTVDYDLALYFGEGSERGLLVLEADPSWSPLRSGDVITMLDDGPPDVARLREAFQSRRPVRVTLLRRKRPLNVTLSGRE